MSTPHLIPDMHPGDPDWLRVISASKIAAVVGLSPYESRYSLWHLMAGNTQPEPNNAILQRGHYLEPAIADWFADQCGEDDSLPRGLFVMPAGTYAHPDNPAHVASPDRTIFHGNDLHFNAPPSGPPLALLEIKSALNDWEWGATGTDEIPIGYRCQVQWQLYVMGLDLCYVAAITSHLEFRWYRIERDQDDIDYLVQQADLFLASIDQGIEPDVDASEHTYAAIRELHPDIDGTTVEIDAVLAAQWVETLAAEKTTKATKQALANRIAHAMGNAQYAACNNITYARRQTRKGTTPYLVAPAGLIERNTAA